MRFRFKALCLALTAVMTVFAFAGCNGGSSTATTALSTGGTSLAATSPAPTTPIPTTTPAPTTPPPTFADAVVLDCTQTDYNKLGSKITVQSANPDPPDGLTAYWFSPAKSGDVILQAVIPPFDATQGDYMTGALKVEVYCSDITLMGTESQFEFATKVNDVDENAWNWKNQVVQNGWNTVYLPWDQASITGDPDFSGLTWLRIYDVGRTCDYAIGTISVVPLGEVPPDVINFMEAMM